MWRGRSALGECDAGVQSGSGEGLWGTKGVMGRRGVLAWFLDAFWVCMYLFPLGSMCTLAFLEFSFLLKWL